RSSAPLPFSPAPATTATYTLSLHDALPIYPRTPVERYSLFSHLNYEVSDRTNVFVEASFGSVESYHLGAARWFNNQFSVQVNRRSEEHTSELQSRENLVCRLLLEKKKKKEK